MPRRRSSAPPLYFLHAKTGEARVCYYDSSGKRHTATLGKFGTPESREKYQRILATLAAPPPPPAESAPAKLPKSPSVVEFCDAFADHALAYYGPKSTEFYYYGVVIGVLIEDARTKAMKVASFGLAELKAARERMIARGWTRPTVNAHVRRVRTMFRWGVEAGIVPAAKWGELQALSGLKRGRVALPEYRDVLPAVDVDVEATLPHLTPTVARMVRFQRLAGCRPQDVCNLKWEEIDRSGEIWIFRPTKHKNAYRGQARAVYIGPKAQAILAEIGGSVGYVFSPARAQAEHRDAKRKPRKPWQLAQKERLKKPAPKRQPRERYSSDSYGRAVLRACKRAGVPPWAPNQLRHAALTDFRAAHGLEIARAIGGHKSAVTTEIYAEKPTEAVLKIIAAKG